MQETEQPSGDSGTKPRMALEESHSLNQSIHSPHVAGLLDDEPNEHACVDEMKSTTKLYLSSMNGQSMWAIQYVSINNTPKLALTRTISPNSNDKGCERPDALLAVLKNPAYRFKRIGLEAGPLSRWLFSALAEAGLPVICVDLSRPFGL